jgi:hypothetical protein
MQQCCGFSVAAPTSFQLMNRNGKCGLKQSSMQNMQNMQNINWSGFNCLLFYVLTPLSQKQLQRHSIVHLCIDRKQEQKLAEPDIVALLSVFDDSTFLQ